MVRVANFRDLMTLCQQFTLQVNKLPEAWLFHLDSFRYQGDWPFMDE